MTEEPLNAEESAELQHVLAGAEPLHLPRALELWERFWLYGDATVEAQAFDGLLPYRPTDLTH